MSEDNNGSGKRERSLLEEIQQMRVDADKGREPELLTSRFGTRSYSRAALIERIVDGFVAEHGGGSDALHEADTEAKRLKLILATTDYTLAVESIQISDSEKANVIRRVYNELFTYGPLDDLLADQKITTISLEGSEKVSVRYGHGELTQLPPIFDDESHLRRITQRLLLDSGAEINEENPIIEAGMTVNGRRVAVNIVGPPVTFQITVDIRVHPAEPITLNDFVSDEVMSTQAADLLRAIATSKHGFVIVGDTEAGKTTLLSAMVALMDGDEIISTVERAGELHLPENAVRNVVQWTLEDREGITFSQHVAAALETDADVIILDEVRTDEAAAVYPLLSNEDTPRQIWAFRGPADVKRLTSALGMLARRSGGDPEASERLVRAMYERLPFVITLRRRQNKLQLHGIGEWYFPAGEDYPTFVELMEMGWEGLELTGKRPSHALNLGDSFWDK